MNFLVHKINCSSKSKMEGWGYSSVGRVPAQHAQSCVQTIALYKLGLASGLQSQEEETETQGHP